MASLRLFISYSHTDKWLVKQVTELLREAGHAPWFDEELIAGRDWNEEIGGAIQSCDAFLYFLTQSRCESRGRLKKRRS